MNSWIFKFFPQNGMFNIIKIYFFFSHGNKRYIPNGINKRNTLFNILDAFNRIMIHDKFYCKSIVCINPISKFFIFTPFSRGLMSRKIINIMLQSFFILYKTCIINHSVLSHMFFNQRIPFSMLNRIYIS